MAHDGDYVTADPQVNLSIPRSYLSWALARLEVENNPIAYGFSLIDSADPEEFDQWADRRAFLFEAQAYALVEALERACQHLPRSPSRGS